MSIIEKPTKDKILIVSEPRSGSTALWTYLWARYYQNGVGGKPMSSWLEPFNYQFHLESKTDTEVNELKADWLMRMILKKPNNPWLTKILLPTLLPIEHIPMHHKVLAEINGNRMHIDKWFEDEKNPTEDELKERTRCWDIYFNEMKVKTVQNKVVGDVYFNDPSVYRIKLYRKDFIASLMSTMDLKIRQSIRKEQGEEDEKLDWHARKDELDKRPVYEYPDLSDMSTAEIADLCGFWQKTFLRENLLRFNSTSTPSMRFDAEYAYEDIKDELLNFNPVIEFDEDNRMHNGNREMLVKKSGITITKKAQNYQETYERLSKAYRQWHKRWPDIWEKRGLQRFSV